MQPRLLHAQDYTLGPDSQPRDGVPKGTVTRLKLEPGKFYPGTPHNYAIYVPAQYNAAKPAPFMIFLDGSGSLNNSVRVPVVFDNLIASGDLPPLDRHLRRSRVRCPPFPTPRRIASSASSNTTP